jgi:hypothetical protein
MANALYRKFETNIPGNETAITFLHPCICERFTGIFPRLVLKRNTAKQVEYVVGIYKSLTVLHECRNWERGRAVSFMGIFWGDFWYSVCGYLGYLKVGPVIFSLL